MKVISRYISVNKVTSHELDGKGSFQVRGGAFSWLRLRTAADTHWVSHPLGKDYRKLATQTPSGTGASISQSLMRFIMFSFSWLCIHPISIENKHCRVIGWLMNWKGFVRKQSWLNIGKSRHVSDGVEECTINRSQYGWPLPRFESSICQIQV
jgi:hypothetical protein